MSPGNRHARSEQHPHPLTASLLPTFGNMIFVGLLAFLAFHVGSGLLIDGDSGYHIRTGDLILAEWRVPRYDPYSQHTPTLPWTAHEWLSAVIMSALYRFFGLTGVVIFFSALLAAIHWLLYRVLRAQSGDILLCVGIVLLAAAASSSHWMARPHIFSLALILVWYDLLNRFQYRHERTLVYLPAIMLFWVNLHGGSIMGLILLAGYLAANMFYSVFGAPAQAADARRKAKWLSWCAAATLLATLVNPAGYQILIFPFHLAGDRWLMDRVTEFMSPNFHAALPFKYMLMATIAAVALSRTRLGLIETGLLTLATYMALYSVRHVSLFAIIAAPILLKAVEGLVEQLPARCLNFYRQRNANLSHLDSRLRGHFWPAGALFLVASLGWGGHLSFKFSDQVFPVAAVEFLQREPIAGNMFNNDEFGDYVIFAAWPRYRVFIDGRSDMYRAPYIQPYLTAANALPGWREVLNGFNIDWVFFKTYSPLTAALSNDKDWQPVYSDHVATIFLKRSSVNQPLLEKYPRVTVVRP